MRNYKIYLVISFLLLGNFSNVFSQNFPDSLGENKKAIKAYFFKNNLSLRNAALQTAYAFNKSEIKTADTLPFKQGWKLTFFDNFDSLDLKKWRRGQAWGEYHSGNPHQYYSSNEIKTKDGLLYLGGSYSPKKFVRADTTLTIPYAIGLINSDISFSQKYGYFEIRSKNPRGAATWPAFWLTGEHRWPPEIDIFEMYGRQGKGFIHNQFATIHWGKDGKRSRGFMTKKINLPNNTDTVFHVYGCEWNAKRIKFYTDVKLVRSIKVNKRLRKWLDDEMVVIINNSFDEKYLKYLPADFNGNQFVVDWVRVYRKN
jgi:beta-glucanase (GH16 family)